jgi:hypothetical protein
MLLMISLIYSNAMLHYGVLYVAYNKVFYILYIPCFICFIYGISGVS